MKCEIINGVLKFTEFSETEKYALAKWFEDGARLSSEDGAQPKAVPGSAGDESAVTAAAENAAEVTESVKGASGQPETPAAEVASENDDASLNRDEIKKELKEMGVKFNERLRLPALLKLRDEARAKQPKPKNIEKVVDKLNEQVKEEKKEAKVEGAKASEIDIFDIESPGDEVSIDKLRKALIEYAKKRGKTAAVSLINDYGASCVSEIKAGDYQAIYKKASDL
jgi:uncharacterized protein (UPF0147 family)